jgi:hypothetical protein
MSTVDPWGDFDVSTSFPFIVAYLTSVIIS